MKRALAALLLVLGLTAPALAQISIPNTFVPNTRIVSADVNENFTELGDKSLNREGGAATGDIVFGTKIIPDVDGGADIGTAALRFGTVYVTDLDIADDLVVTSILVESTGATSIQTLGGITAGSGEVGIVDTSGRIPALSAVFVANLSGANLTDIPETAITDGALLARVGSDETIAGSWSFTSSPLITNAAPALSFTETGAAANAGRTTIVHDSNLFQVQLLTDAGAVGATPFYITRSGATATDVTVAATTFGFGGATFNVTTSGNINLVGGNAAIFTTPTVTNTGRYESAEAQPGFHARQTGTSEFTTSGSVLGFNSEAYDTGGVFGSNVFTVPLTGIYQVCFGMPIHPDGSGVVYVRVRNTTLPATILSWADDFATSVPRYASACAPLSLTAGHTLQLEYVHSGADDADYAMYGEGSAFFSARLVP